MKHLQFKLAGPLLAASLLAPLTGWAADGYVSRTYAQLNLVSNVAGLAQTQDPNLVNPWGVTNVPTGPFWVSDNGNGLSTLYDGLGNVVKAVFTVAAPPGQTTPAAPTGIVWNPTRGFLVPGTALPATFIFDTEDGTISAWTGGLSPANVSVIAVNNAGAGAVYKGLAFGTTAAGGFLYATNFRAGTVDVFDSTFAPAGGKLTGTFSDPLLPPRYAPFGIQNVSGNLVVTYAKQDSAKHDNLDGQGLGIVDIFDTDGNLIERLATGGPLNAPWGVALAPAGFGVFSNDILIGNFGDGHINAYTPNGRFRGTLLKVYDQPFAERGLWSIIFGSATSASPRTLYFSAGINGEKDGLFGALTPAQGTMPVEYGGQ